MRDERENQGPYGDFHAELVSMKRDLAHLVGSIRRVRGSSLRQQLPDERLRWLFDILNDQEFHPDLIESIVSGIDPSSMEPEPHAELGPGTKPGRVMKRTRQVPSAAKGQRVRGSRSREPRATDRASRTMQFRFSPKLYRPMST